MISDNNRAIKSQKAIELSKKVKPFQQHYSYCLSSSRKKSNMHRLACEQYSHSLKKVMNSSRKTSKSSYVNPEMSRTVVEGLNNRTSQMITISDINTDLLIEKKMLEDKITTLKEAIAKETRKKNKAEEHWKIASNNREHCKQHKSKLLQKEDQLKESQEIVRKEAKMINNEGQELYKQNQKLKKKISKQTTTILKLEELTVNLKNKLFWQQKTRQEIKHELICAQKRMDAASIATKEIQNERARMLLQINQEVQRNKL